MKSTKSLLLVLVFNLVSGVSSWAQIINTFPAWDGSSNISPVGESGITTIGQLFSAPTGFDQLNTFGFAISHLGGDTVQLNAVIAEWDAVNFHASTNVLFVSDTIFIDQSISGFAPLVLPTGGLQLDITKQYVAFLTSTLTINGSPDAASLGFLGLNTLSGSGVVALANGADASLLFNSPWLGSENDLVFAAAFSQSTLTAVPEPSTYGVLAALSAVGIAIRRRSRKTA